LKATTYPFTQHLARFCEQIKRKGAQGAKARRKQ